MHHMVRGDLQMGKYKVVAQGKCDDQTKQVMIDSISLFVNAESMEDACTKAKQYISEIETVIPIECKVR